ncbi:hypothetical protein Q604_UNBC09876G0001, partial [human gut metagenome]
RSSDLMGAVAYADTVDLGYGLYGSTSPTVKAVEVMRVPTDAKLRNNEQSQIISVANKAAVDAVNTSLKLHSYTDYIHNPYCIHKDFKKII